ncbi:hypothetical protein QUF74_05160 [Candidatus Halobeggiatoa sp. HSG11]|nr:hypothetical protein [Candidatus Halobeggiatoa sp. HSG11]
MFKDKFIAFLKAAFLLVIMSAILFFNTKLPESTQIVEQKTVDEVAIHKEVERLQKNKIVVDTAQKYRQQVLEQEQKEYQVLSVQNKEYIETLSSQQRKKQQQLNKLKKERKQAEQELEKIRQEREKLTKTHANSSNN